MVKKNFLLCIALALTLVDTTAQQLTVGQMSITVESSLNPQHKVPGHLLTDGYDGPIGIKLRGNSSLGFNQKKYTIELRDADGKEVEAPLLGMPAHSDWVLLAPYNDVSAVRDPLAFQLWRDMGHWGPRTRIVELTLNGDYRGIYILSEAIKRGIDRVNIAKLKKTDVKGRDVTGGYLLRIDTYNQDDATFTSKVPGIGEGNMTSQVIWSCIYPKKKKLQPEQFDYIHNYVDTVEQVIQSETFADPERGYARYIDVPSFVDYFIHTELSLNADGYKRSAYFYKEKLNADGTGGKLVAGPVWDYNLAYGNANFANANNLEAWCFEGASNNPTPAMWQRLLQDPVFRKAVKVRYKALRKGVLSNKAINAYIDCHAKLLAPCIGRHFERYPELLVSEEEKEQLMAQPFGQFPPMGGFQMPDSLPLFPGGFPPMGDFQMPDSILPFPVGFPPMGNFQMPDSISPFPGGFPPMGDFEGFGGGFNAASMFAAYRVSSYDEEIQILKEWLAKRLAFLDRNIKRFDKDWEPRIQELKEIKMPQWFR
ncbi:MAG: CotH kinase family protein [Prevotella sp.]|nr:CotH kinase family protein [Prevotella sp.]